MARGEHGLGAAFDGDGDRNMILGKVKKNIWPPLKKTHTQIILGKLNKNIWPPLKNTHKNYFGQGK